MIARAGRSCRDYDPAEDTVDIVVCQVCGTSVHPGHRYHTAPWQRLHQLHELVIAPAIKRGPR